MKSRLTRTSAIAASVLALSLGLSACGSSNDPSASSSAAASANDNPITVLIGSSGDAETKAVKDAVAAWSADSGVSAEVVVASDLTQEATQGFASGEPADVLYVSTDQFAGWAGNGSLLAYGDELSNKDDFYPGLKEAFTYDGKFYCAPKDFSTLALVINEDLWADAGLTDADIPTTWDQLSAVAKKLTTGDTVGLAFGPEVQRLGVFMAQAGGGMVTDGAATVNSAANLSALEYVKQNMTDGVFAYSSDIGAGWGGEAFGKGLSAMTIEGNWITGAMTNDFPDVNYKVVELPSGTQPGTLQYTNCWGISTDGDNTAASKSLVEYLTTADQQLAFSKAFGPMPSIESAKAQWTTDNPELAAFVNGAEYAQNLPSMTGASDVITEFNSQLATLKDSDPKTILDSVQGDMEAVLA